MKSLRDLSVSISLALSILLMPIWLTLTEPYTVRPSPLKLFEAIHPAYYAGLVALILSLIILSIRARSIKWIISPYLATAVLVTLYLQLPPIALFEHPMSDHTLHLTPAFYMLREGNINMPNYPFPETISPQLFASILLMITSLPDPLENLHRISLLLLPLLTTLYIYIFMKRLGANERFAMMASALNMGLTFVLFMFLRQTYAMPLYIMLGLLTFVALKERKAGFSVLAIITSMAFVMSDPAHVILTIISLTLFTITWFVTHGVGLASEGKHFRSPSIFIALFSVMFLSWVVQRFPSMPISLWNIAKRMWDIFVKSITEFAYPLPEGPTYWGKPAALAFNDYYASLYRMSVALKAISIALPTALLAYILFNKKTRHVIFRPETLFLAAYFLITAIVIVTRGYGFTYTPWAVMTIFYLLAHLADFKRINRKSQQALLGLTILLVVVSVAICPHINYSGGGMRMSTSDIHALRWLITGNLQTNMLCPGWGTQLSDFTYVETGRYVKIMDYLFYEGFTPESLSMLAEQDNVIIVKTILFYLEKTEAIFLAPKAFRMLADELSNHHSLIYSSGYPFCTIWLSKEA